MYRVYYLYAHMSTHLSLSLSISLSLYIYIYLYVHTVNVCIYVREGVKLTDALKMLAHKVS